MKDRGDILVRRQFEFIGHRVYFSYDSERANTTGGQFMTRKTKTKIPSRQPDTITYLVLQVLTTPSIGIVCKSANCSGDTGVCYPADSHVVPFGSTSHRLSPNLGPTPQEPPPPGWRAGWDVDVQLAWEQDNNMTEHWH